MPQPPEVEAPHFIEIDGRRWRATDPSIPDAFRKELVDELMRARRAIGVLIKAGDDELLADARRQVSAAKIALGERGEPWWDEPSVEGRRQRIEAAILALAGHRAPEGTICPSDAARAIGGAQWRSLVPAVRDVARDLARAGQVQVTQGGTPLDPDADWKGPVRIRLTPS
ncbi:MAG: hypothetical protein JWO77_574 [Ilumatobacteraceae bacterium]|nr:hypothetical protein [Ilumatobacteraceae bacterium]